MEKIRSSETSQKKLWLSKNVQNYSRAIAFSIATILWIQSSNSIADNLLSDSTLQISKPLKESEKSKKYISDLTKTLSYLIIESSYTSIEKNRWIISAIEQRLQDDCNMTWNSCEKEIISFFDDIEKEIISFFKEDLPNGTTNISIILNQQNVGNMLDLFPYVESLLSARYWENYMDVLNKQTIENAEYNLKIIVTDKNWEFKIESIKLEKNVE